MLTSKNIKACRMSSSELSCWQDEQPLFEFQTQVVKTVLYRGCITKIHWFVSLVYVHVKSVRNNMSTWSTTGWGLFNITPKCSGGRQKCKNACFICGNWYSTCLSYCYCCIRSVNQHTRKDWSTVMSVLSQNSTWFMLKGISAVCLHVSWHLTI